MSRSGVGSCDGCWRLWALSPAFVLGQGLFFLFKSHSIVFFFKLDTNQIIHQFNRDALILINDGWVRIAKELYSGRKSFLEAELSLPIKRTHCNTDRFTTRCTWLNLFIPLFPRECGYKNSMSTETPATLCGRHANNHNYTGTINPLTREMGTWCSGSAVTF